MYDGYFSCLNLHLVVSARVDLKHVDNTKIMLLSIQQSNTLRFDGLINEKCKINCFDLELETEEYAVVSTEKVKIYEIIFIYL